MSRVQASLVPASAVPGPNAWQPQILLPGKGPREGVRVQIREQFTSNLEWQNEWKSELGVGINQATEHEGKTWERQRNDIDTKD